MQRWLAVLLLCVLIGGSAYVLTAKPAPTAPPDGPRLTLANPKDGDSFVASDGVEYRLGMINTPEIDEPCGREAAAFTRQFLASGFTVDAYSTDPHHRRVAEVFNLAGTSLNVTLAGNGLSDDRYLDPFWDENPDLARRLDEAFSTASKPACRS